MLIAFTDVTRTAQKSGDTVWANLHLNGSIQPKGDGAAAAAAGATHLRKEPNTSLLQI